MKYVLFDVDGVLLNEDRCFDVSALVLWEWYNNAAFFKITNDTITYTPTEAKIRELRSRYYVQDKMLAWLKSYGINSNWDMEHAHIVAMLALLWQKYPLKKLPEGDITFVVVQNWAAELQQAGLQLSEIPTDEEIFAWLQSNTPEECSKNDFFHNLVKVMSKILNCSIAEAQFVNLGESLWELSAEIFQSWYFGSKDIAFELPGQVGEKEGFLHHEIPTADPQKIKILLQDLKNAGYIIGIGTGRSLKETKIPLQTFDWWSEFESEHISNADEAVKAQNACGGEALDKPHPFTYQCAYFGVINSQNPADYEKVYNEYVHHPEKFTKKGDSIYIVGDSIADVWAAQKMGAHIIATLTGLTGPAIRPKLEKMNVDYIVEDVLGIRKILLKKD